jgi:hypothetical protein
MDGVEGVGGVNGVDRSPRHWSLEPGVEFSFVRSKRNVTDEVREHRAPLTPWKNSGSKKLTGMNMSELKKLAMMKKRGVRLLNTRAGMMALRLVVMKCTMEAATTTTPATMTA